MTALVRAQMNNFLAIMPQSGRMTRLGALLRLKLEWLCDYNFNLFFVDADNHVVRDACDD